jgi:hypothetical protein
MEEWITTVESCKISGYHINHMRLLIRKDKIIARKFGPIWQVNRASLIEYLKSVEEQGKKRGPKTKEIVS